MPFDTTPTVRLKPVSRTTQALQRARNLIAKGWVAGTRRDGNGNFCALGAVDEAIKGIDCTPRWYAELIGRLARFATYEGVDTYNYWRKVNARWDPNARVAAHNNMLGQEATLRMFDQAIAYSEEQDNAV